MLQSLIYEVLASQPPQGGEGSPLKARETQGGAWGTVQRARTTNLQKDTRPSVPWGTGRAAVSRPLPSTRPDLSDSHLQGTPRPPTPARACPLRRGDPLPPGCPAPTGQRDALQGGGRGSGWAQRSATPGRRLRREFAARGFPPGGGALGLGQGSARPPPPPPLPAPPSPGPWRLRGCRSERWSRARGGRAGGKVRRRREPRGPAGQPGGRLAIPFRFTGRSPGIFTQRRDDVAPGSASLLILAAYMGLHLGPTQTIQDKLFLGRSLTSHLLPQKVKERIFTVSMTITFQAEPNL
ncbi:translation initiation factor IF-2-like isoform X2 [Lutra lutra]|uniref:translation initiation factor IF-2-like isoform X2 n=1 Tax=Lutra lutra TaxID=9657 RepID=UPI001FD6199E|nr:translation initiation factor IF-2-like isoform X2 [Lutra lutra]